MFHHLLLKFKEDCYTNDIYILTIDVFSKLKNDLPGLVNVSVYENCVFRQSNADIMIVMELAQQETLETYLQHSLHTYFVQQIEELLNTKITFDYCPQ